MYFFQQKKNPNKSQKEAKEADKVEKLLSHSQIFCSFWQVDGFNFLTLLLNEQ